MGIFSDNGPYPIGLHGMVPQRALDGLGGFVRQGMDQNKKVKPPPSPIVLQAIPTSVSGNGLPVNEGNYTDDVTVSQLSGPDGSVLTSYSWAIVAGGVYMNATYPTAATTNFYSLFGPAGGDVTSIWRCTVMNNYGQTGFIDVTARVYSGAAAPGAISVSAGYNGGFSHPSGTPFVLSGNFGYAVTPSYAPFTQSWSTSAGSFDDPSAYDPTLTVASQPPGTPVNISVYVTVTDNLGNVGISNAVAINLVFT